MLILTDKSLNYVAEFLKSLAQPTRLNILQILYSGEMSVNQLAGKLKIHQSNISKHLSILLKANVLTSRKEGVTVFYKLADPNVVRIWDAVCHSVAKSFQLDSSVSKNFKNFRRK